jgi:hypothetical protein
MWGKISSNCLVGKGFTVKISDVAVYRTLFARDYYYIDGRGSLPVRWMAPETLLWVRVQSFYPGNCQLMWPSSSSPWNFGCIGKEEGSGMQIAYLVSLN